MAVQLKALDPFSSSAWDEMVISAGNYSFFHSSGWAKAISEAYDYDPLYFVVHENGRTLALAPIMQVKSLISGKRGVSLPFSDYCEPIISDESRSDDVFNCLAEYGGRAGWRYLEVRGGSFLSNECYKRYYMHKLDLSLDENSVFNGFRDSTRRNIKKSIKSGVRTEVSISKASLDIFYRLNCITRRAHGLPPQPYRFFQKLYEHIISRQNGIVVLAYFEEKCVAGGVYFHIGKKALYKYGASDMRYQHLRANNLVMWEALKWYCRHGFKMFCFGRSEANNKGLLQFKTGWGAKQYLINYYRFDLKKGCFINGHTDSHDISFGALKRMPMGLLRLIGEIAYRHVG